MKFHTPLFLLLVGFVAAYSQDEPKLNLIYTVKNQEYAIHGFENQTPYYIKDGKKVFPEAPGSWQVEGDLENLRRYAYLPNFVTLEKLRRTFKDGHDPEGLYREVWDSFEKIPVQQDHLVPSMPFWNINNLAELVVVNAWIHPDKSMALVLSINPAELLQMRMDNVRGRLVRGIRKEGYPAIWLLNPETMAVYKPATDHLHGKTLLNWLAKAGTLEEFESTWKSEGDTKLFSDGEYNPLHFLALYNRKGFLNQIPELEELVDEKDEIGNTMGHYAAGIGNLAILKELQKPERTLNTANDNGLYPTHIAVETGHSHLSRWLISEMGQKNKMSSQNISPIAAALNARRYDIVEYLVPLKPNRLRAEKTSLNALFIVLCKFGWSSMVEYLLSYYPRTLKVTEDFDPVKNAILSGNPEVLKLILEKTKEFSSGDAEAGYLHLAAAENSPEMIELLLARGLEVDGTFSQNLTALHLAVTTGNLEATLKLLEKGANPEITPEGGVSAIWAATYLGNREEIQALIEAGASCELNPDFANTMVEYATLYDIPEVVLIAMEKCLTPDYELYEEFPGIFVADYFGSTGVKKILAEHGQSLKSIKVPTIVASGDLDSKLKFTRQPRLNYPQDLMKKYGDLKTRITAICNKDGNLILPKFDPALPSDLTRHLREVLKQWAIEPPTVNGELVNLKIVFPLELKREIQKAKIYEISTLDVGPKPIKQVAPIYPRALRNQRVQTTITLAFIVHENGRVIDVQVIQGSSPAFAESAIKAVKQWVFKPGIKDGKAVKTRVQLPLSFSLRP